MNHSSNASTSTAPTSAGQFRPFSPYRPIVTYRLSYQARPAPTGFSSNAPVGVTSNATFDPTLRLYSLRNGAGIVTRPQVENFTR